MKKSLAGLVIAISTATLIMSGCGGSSSQTETTAAAATTETAAEEEDSEASDSTSTADGEYEDAGPSVGALVNSPGYTGLTSLEVDNNFHGGHYYKDQTEDLLTVIVNTAFEADLGENESPEDMLARNLELVDPGEARDIVISSNDEQSARFTYPAYYITWLTGQNEDTIDWTAMAVLTDGYTYIYAYGTYADYAEEMKDTWYESFETIELFFP